MKTKTLLLSLLLGLFVVSGLQADGCKEESGDGISYIEYTWVPGASEACATIYIRMPDGRADMRVRDYTINISEVPCR